MKRQGSVDSDNPSLPGSTDNLGDVFGHHKMAEARPVQRARTLRLVHLSLWLHVAMAATLLVSVVCLYCEMTRNLAEVRSELGLTKQPISKRSSGTQPSVHGLLQQKIPGMEAIQLVGTVPIVRVNKNGTIGPWHQANGEIKWASLSRDGGEILFTYSGLYFIYAQVFYLTTETSNSFEIARWRGPRRAARRETLTLCANQASAPSPSVGVAAEVSCYTGLVAALDPGDRLSLHQIEQDRVILFSQGFSHWGVIRLQNNQQDS